MRCTDDGFVRTGTGRDCGHFITLVRWTGDTRAQLHQKNETTQEMLWILMSLQCHQWPSFPSTKQSLPSWRERDQQDRRQCLELVDAARNAQAKLRAGALAGREGDAT